MSKIQWTDVTDNPIHLEREDGSHGGHWCRKVSPGCANCYAETQNQSGFFPWASKLPYTGQRPENLTFDRSIVEGWARARKPQRRFVCSMTDLFGEWVPADWHKSVFDAAAAAPLQTIQILTKRPHVALVAIAAWCDYHGKDKLPPNVWIGVTVEDQQRADEHQGFARSIAELCEITFVSYEPALELVNWQGWEFLNWMLIGGESGNGARPFYLEWGHQAIAWCQEHRVKPFMKQLGDNPMWFVNSAVDPPEKPPWMLVQFRGVDGLGVTGKGSNPAEWPSYLRVREFPGKPSATLHQPAMF
jgi:protein gp37